MEMMAVCEGCGVLYRGYLTRIINRSPVLREWLELGDRDLSIVCLLVIRRSALSGLRREKKRNRL
ncbi:MAG: hypothetical protein V8S96_05285 [Lachnospiraceae bacterium]